MSFVEGFPEKSRVVPINTQVHPTAIVAPGAKLGAHVEIGPFSIVGEHVTIGDETKIGAHVVIEGQTTIGKKCRIYTGAIIGNEPQDLKYRGEQTSLFIGDGNVIREYVTISRGTASGTGETRIGNENLLMSCVHVGHDVQMGSGNVIAHGTGFGGHAVIEDRVTIGGICGIHQFVKVGRMSMIGAHSMITRDVPPYVLAKGNPPKLYGVNIVGLRRNGLSPDLRLTVQKAYRILYRSGLNITQAIEEMERELPASEEIDHFLRFLRNTDRGICR